MGDRLRRLLLVDDDAVMRIGLKTMLDWRQHGYLLVGEAVDGAEALELAKRELPDVVLTDMKMPVMDGVALIRALRELPSPPGVVVLSSYDDFTLVREAMKLGAADYLLKLEITPAALLQSLSHADHGRTDAVAPEEDRIFARRQALRDLVGRFYLDEADIERRLREAGVRFAEGTVYCLLIKAGEMYRFEEATEEECYTLCFSVQSIAEEIAGDCLDAYCVEGKTGEFYILGSVKSALAGEDNDLLVEQTARRLREMLAQYVDISCTIGIGIGDHTAAGLAQACRQAADAVRSRFYAADSSILWWRGELPETVSETYSTYPLRCQLSRGLEALNADEVSAALSQMRADLTEKHLSRHAVLSALLDLASTVRDVFERRGVEAGTLLPDSRCDLVELAALQSTREVCRWLGTLERELLRDIAAERAGSGQNVVRRARVLIEARYAQDIGVADVAAELELTPGYLSALMKKHTGLNFSEYLTRVRIEAAKKLLDAGTEKIYEVAEQVGYEDPYYFSRLFKRMTGVSPSDWRNRGNREGKG